MRLPRIRRRWKVKFHFKSGNTVTEYLREMAFDAPNNELRRLNRTDMKISLGTSDYMRLNEIEAISSKRSWSFYLDWS